MTLIVRKTFIEVDDGQPDITRSAVSDPFSSSTQPSPTYEQCRLKSLGRSTSTLISDADGMGEDGLSHLPLNPRQAPLSDLAPSSPLGASPAGGNLDGDASDRDEQPRIGKIVTEEIWPDHSHGVEWFGGVGPNGCTRPPHPAPAWAAPQLRSAELPVSPPGHAPDIPTSASAASQEQQQQQQPSTLAREVSRNSGCVRIKWTVDAHKLDKKDKQAVSPPFDLTFSESDKNIPFKMIIYPKNVCEAKGGASFRKAKGKGFIQVKCEAELAAHDIKFRLSVGSEGKMQTPRGPVSHNFSQSAVCGLPKREEEWDFCASKDVNSNTFMICLEIMMPNAVCY